MLAAVTVFAGVTIMLVRHQLHSSLDGALRTRALEAAQLAVSAPALLTDPGALESPVSGREIAVEVLDRRGTILARSQTLGARLLPQDRLVRAARIEGRSGYEDIRIADHTYRLFVAPVAEAGGPAAGGAILVASDTTDIRDTVAHLGAVLAVSGAAIALIAALIAAGLTRRGLQPLRRLVAGAEQIERTADAARRLPETGTVSDEIAQLTGVLNRMLASLERSRANERRFLADASHELRTPVTTLLGNVHYARRHGADADVLADLERDADRLARLVDDLLVLERHAEGGERERGTDAASLVELDRLVQTVAAEHAAGVVRLGTLEPTRMRGDEEALRRIVSNLVENAIVHGPSGQPVDVSLTQHNATVRLEVRDQGPGPDAATRERMFERFWRAPDASGRPGSGLGLAITQAIVARYGGTIEVDGSTFAVELPLEPLSAEAS